MRLCGPEPAKGGEVLCWYTRVYAGKDADGKDIPPSLPGPTIITHPGEKLQIKVVNGLKDPTPSCVETEVARANGLLTFFGYNLLTANGFCHVNTTNLHTHGLHVSPRRGADDIFETIKPGRKKTTKLTLPKYHMPGIHWYHPHRHHATSVQAGGGLHGAILIPDAKGSVPKEIADMPDNVMVLSLIDMKYWLHANGIFGQSTLEAFGLGNLWKDQNDKYVNQDTAFLFVNGQYKPSFKMTAGKWYRFRMVYAAVEMALQIFSHFNVQANCEIRLLAKDGVYLNVAPRNISTIHLASGNRADVAMRCSCTGPARSCTGRLISSAKIPAPLTNVSTAALPDKIEEWLEGVKDHAKDGPWMYVFQPVVNQVLMTMEISKDRAKPPEPEFKQFKVNRPCYLVDLRGVSVKKKNQGRIEMMDPPNWRIKWANKINGGPSYGTPMVDEHTQPPLTYMKVGQVQEWYIRGPEAPGFLYNNSYTGLSLHPFHIHVMPFQLNSLSNPTGSPYWELGDWQDTFLHGTGQALVKTQTDKFTGRWILHCHLLDHEDMGMMGYFKVGGIENSWWKGARQVDPDCYRDQSGIGYKYVTAPAELVGAGWHLTEPGENCHFACSEKGGCSGHWPTGDAEMTTLVAAAGGTCKSFDGPETDFAPSVQDGVCSVLPDADIVHMHRCGVVPPENTQRFCYCRGYKK